MFKTGIVGLNAPASIKFNELEWTETADGYIECDLGLMKWEIHLATRDLFLNERYFIDNFDTVDAAKSAANNMMQEFIDKFCVYG